MKKQFKLSSLAMAVAAATVLASSPALAWNWGGDNGNRDPAAAGNETSVAIHKHIDENGDIKFHGNIKVGSDAEAAIHDGQTTHSNVTNNVGSRNSASVDDNVARDAQGNVQLNSAAGDNNAQANEASLAYADANAVFGMATAQVFNKQDSHGNATNNQGTSNRATMGGNAFRNAAGNIGVNVASGNNNLQKNALSASATQTNVAIATINNDQSVSGNLTNNTPLKTTTSTRAKVNLKVALSGGYAGISDQKGNLYPDIWGADGHDSSKHPTDHHQTGHFDLDDQAQGSYDRSQPSGFDSAGNPTGNSRGGALSFNEAGDILLSGSATGSMPVTTTTYTNVVNTAHIGGNALRGAAGNIGANVASGNNNLQSNIMTVAAALNSGTAGNGGE